MSSYAPLFPYSSAGLLWVWNSPKVFALLAIVLNMGTLWLWHAAASVSFDRITARQATVLYAASGQVLVQALLGTNQAWIAAAIAGSVLLIVRGRSAISGCLQGAAVCCVKVLALLFWPVLWMFAPRRGSWLVGALSITVAVYGTFGVRGADLLYPLTHEGELISSGNLPYLLQPLLAGYGHFAYRVFDGLTLLALAALTAWLYLRVRPMAGPAKIQLLAPALALVELVFMLFSKKSFPGYALFCMYPLNLVLIRGIASYGPRVALFSLLNILLAIESSWWFYLDGDNKTLDSWLSIPHGPGVQLFLVADATLVACYAYLAWLSVKWLRALPTQNTQAACHSVDSAAEGVAVNHVQSS
jgi:hypothetical protein